MKQYVKPELYYESFELTQSIAGNCTVIQTSGNKDACSDGVHYGDSRLDPYGVYNFILAFACAQSVDNMEINQDYCYTPSDASYVISAS